MRNDRATFPKTLTLHNSQRKRKTRGRQRLLSRGHLGERSSARVVLSRIDHKVHATFVSHLRRCLPRANEELRTICLLADHGHMLIRRVTTGSRRNLVNAGVNVRVIARGSRKINFFLPPCCVASAHTQCFNDRYVLQYWL